MTTLQHHPLMTHEQLKAAAVYLCVMRGENPDERVLMDDGRGNLHDMAIYCERWENAAREIQDHELMAESIRHGRAT